MARANFTLRLTDAEAARIKTSAAAAGISVSEHLRRAALGTQPVAVPAFNSGHLDDVTRRLADLLTRAETDGAANRETLALLNKAGSGFNALLVRFTAAAPKA